MVERQLFQPLEIKCRGDFVVGEVELLGCQRQRMFKAGKDVDRLRPSAADH